MEKNLQQDNLAINSRRVGDIVKGKIIGIEKSAIYLNLEPFGTGIIYGKEFYKAKDILKDLKIGEEISAKIMDLDNEDGFIELSLTEAQEEITWEELFQKKESGQILTVKILGANKGGLLAKVSGIPAFIPVSHLSAEHYPNVETKESFKILRELQKFINKELEVKILDLSPKEGKLILSEKAKDAEKIKEALKKYKVGDIVKGEVTGIVDFGIFIKFGKEKLEGLCHISELDPKLASNLQEKIKIGQIVKAKIVNIANSRVSLSLKKTEIKKIKGED